MRAVDLDLRELFDFAPQGGILRFAGQRTLLLDAVALGLLRRELIGFAAYECTRRGFFGPMGVVDSAKNSGVGKALLLAALEALKEMGYVYAIVGAAGPVRFYQKTVGAIIIPDSEPGVYTDLLKSKE